MQLARELYEKEVDGFFIDNCDVYYYAPRKDIFDGLTVILQYIMTLGKEVIINGGDTYVTEYKERYGTIDPIMTGVNQETVWSHIDFAKGTFNEQNREEREYFCGYLESCKADGMEVYELTEAIKELSSDKQNINDYLDLFQFWFRDVLMFKATREVDNLVFKQEINYIREQASQRSYENLEKILDALEKTKVRLRANVNTELALELLFLTIREK